MERFIKEKRVYGGMGINDFSSLIHKYGDRGTPLSIAVGLRPSGVIHLGNMATLGLSGVLAKKVGPHLAKVNVTICDLDLPDVKDWNAKDNHYVKYFKDLPARDGQPGSMLDRASANISELIGGLEGVLQVQFTTQKLSDVQRKEGFRAGLKRVLDQKGLMQYILAKVPEGHALVFPLCPECSTSNPHFPRYDSGKLITACNNPSCDIKGQTYEMNVMDCSRDLAVHFFIDPLRDKTVPPYSEVHVFGGDYREAHNSEDATKVEKIIKISKIAGQGAVPDMLIGPMFYARDGTKMSKSKHNGLDIEVLKSHFGGDSAKRIVHLIEYIIKDDLKNVDYSIVDKVLFGKS